MAAVSRLGRDPARGGGESATVHQEKISAPEDQSRLRRIDPQRRLFDNLIDSTRARDSADDGD